MTTSPGARIALTPAEMARARYGEVFGAVPVTGGQLEAVLRIPGFADAWRAARKLRAQRALAKDEAA